MERTPNRHAGHDVLADLLASCGLDGLAALAGVDALIERLARRAGEEGAPCR